MKLNRQFRPDTGRSLREALCHIDDGAAAQSSRRSLNQTGSRRVAARSAAAIVGVVVATPARRRSLRPRLRELLHRFRASHGARSALLLGVAILVMSGAGYLFSLACIRYLGPPGYGDVAALMALIAIVALPLGSVQNALAREVADLTAKEAMAGARTLLRRGVAVAVPTATALLAIGLVFTRTIEDGLKIGSAATVVAGLTSVVVAVVATTLYAFLQGTQRFVSLALTYVLSGLARPILVVPALLAGFGATGALAVNTVAGFGAVLLAGYALRDVWRGPTAAKAPRADPREVGVMVGGSLAFASLTNADVLLASYYLSDREAGIYAAAAFVGKFVLFLPTALTIVLLPKATSRVARGEKSERILLGSAGVTAASTLTAALGLAIMPAGAVMWAFGPAFEDTTPLLAWFGVAMAAAALVNVYLSVYFAQRDARFPLLIGVMAIVQIVVVSLWHPDARSIVVVTFACLGTALVAHELAFPNRLARIWRARRIRFDRVDGPPDAPPTAPFGPL